MLREKSRALQDALFRIEKEYGTGSIMKLGESAADKTVDSISTGSLALDLALGIGGIPRGRVTEIYGPESSGKSTLAPHILPPARHRRTGPGDRGGAGALRRTGRRGGRQRGGPGAPGRAGGRHGRPSDGPPGAPHVPGAAPAGRRH